MARADVAVRLPDAIDDLAAAPLLCGGVIGYRSLHVCGIQPGGGSASSASAPRRAARSRSRSTGAARSTCARARSRAGACTRARRAWAGGYDETPPEPLDAAITFAPAGDVVVAALRALDRGGTVAVNAIHLDRMPEFPYDLLWWERCIRSVANVTREDAREFVELAAAVSGARGRRGAPARRRQPGLARVASGAVRGAAVLVP